MHYKKTISVLLSVMVLPVCHVIASNNHDPNTNESIGRQWRGECRRKAKTKDKYSGLKSLNSDIFSNCCLRKARKCEDEAKNIDEKMKCSKKLSSCFDYNYKSND